MEIVYGTLQRNEEAPVFFALCSANVIYPFTWDRRNEVSPSGISCDHGVIDGEIWPHSLRLEPSFPDSPLILFWLQNPGS